MRKAFLIISWFVLIAITLSCEIQKETKSKATILYEHYQIMARKEKTEVNAVVFFQPNVLDNDEKFFPQKITYNGKSMQFGHLENYSGPSFSIFESKEQIQIKPNEFGIKDKTSGYTFSQPFYSPESNFVVTNLNGDKREFSFKFEPTDFKNPDSIVLSRSKDNFINITGQCSNNDDCSAFFAAESADFPNKDLKIDLAKKQIIVPAEIVKKLKITQPRIIITSKTMGFIYGTVQTEKNIYNSNYGSNYNVVYSTDAVATIVK